MFKFNICTQEARVARGQPQATLTHLSCSQNFFYLKIKGVVTYLQLYGIFIDLKSKEQQEISLPLLSPLREQLVSRQPSLAFRHKRFFGLYHSGKIEVCKGSGTDYELLVPDSQQIPTRLFSNLPACGETHLMRTCSQATESVVVCLASQSRRNKFV